MVQQLTYLKETASQTAGPYVHIGLIPGMAGFDIFEKNFTNILTGPNTKGERITIEGRVIDLSLRAAREIERPEIGGVELRVDARIREGPLIRSERERDVVTRRSKRFQQLPGAIDPCQLAWRNGAATGDQRAGGGNGERTVIGR